MKWGTAICSKLFRMETVPTSSLQPRKIYRRHRVSRLWERYERILLGQMRFFVGVSAMKTADLYSKAHVAANYQVGRVNVQKNEGPSKESAW